MLSVYNDAHLAVMRSSSVVLVCPKPGCAVTFTKPYGPNDGGTRWLANSRGQSCDHVFHAPIQPPVVNGVGGGGGPMSAQHLWFQHRLVTVCNSMEYEAILEHSLTFADVYVPKAKYCLEVQRWPTDFLHRTEARLAKGARVLWLLTEDAKTAGITRALSEHPAVRLRAVSRENGHSLQPWYFPKQNADAILVVGETVAGTRRLKDRSFEKSSMDAAQFLKEVFEGRRVWLPPHQARSAPPSRGGIWVLKSNASVEKPHGSKMEITESDEKDAETSAPTDPSFLNASTDEPILVEKRELTPLRCFTDDSEPFDATPITPKGPPSQLSWWRRAFRWLIEE